MAGMMSQAVVYPLDTLKFRMQCETVVGGERGNKLIWHTAQKMWARNGIASFYRGLPMGLMGRRPVHVRDAEKENDREERQKAGRQRR
jgi:solute carrier family 25 phosphate transporter 23/24/25/41